MSTIAFPQVLIYQEFTLVPSEVTEPMRAMIIGPEYALHRYVGGAAGEKVQAGVYSPGLGLTASFSGLGISVGGAVDAAYTEVYLENAALQYYLNTAGTYTTSSSLSSSSLSSATSYSGSPDSGNTVYNVVGAPNKVYVSNINLANSGSQYPLAGAFSGRAVAAGDRVDISQTINGTTTSFTGYVTGLQADLVPGLVGAAAPSSSNTVTNSSATSASSITKGGTVNSTTITVTAAGYNGLTDGVLSETYTVSVRVGTTGGNAATAVLDITSSSGKDSVTGYVPPLASLTQTLSLGNNGATFVFAMGGNTDLITGQTFRVTLTQQFYAPLAASNSGTPYTGAKDTTYILTVIRGGAVTDANPPILSVTTNNGYDPVGPITVTAASTPYAVGHYGATASFTAASGTLKFALGDAYYVTSTATANGPIRTLVLDRSLPVALQSTSIFTQDLNLSLSIVKNVQLPLQTNYAANWSQSSASVTLSPGIQLTAPEWASGASAIPVIAANVFVHWRELVQTHTDQVYTCDQIGDIATAISTAIDPDNPLGYGLQKALLNANGTSTRFIGVATNDSAGFTAALGKLETRNDFYKLVPLTFDSASLDATAAHVASMSAPEQGYFRSAFVCPQKSGPFTVVQYESDLSTPVAATSSGTTVTLSSSTTTSLITAGVRAGDELRTNLTTGPNGLPTYTSYTVDHVISTTQLATTVAISPAITVNQPIQIWRTPNSSDLATRISTGSGEFTSRRIAAVYPDYINSGGQLVPGYFLCAALAGLSSGVAPHQSLTKATVTGFDDANRVALVFNRSQINQMASAGIWLANTDPTNGAVYTHMGLTTDVTDIDTRDEMITRNVDNISFGYQSRLSKFIGRANVTPSAVGQIQNEVEAEIAYRKGSASFTPSLGPQLIDATVLYVKPHPQLLDRIVVAVQNTVPRSLNNIEVDLIV